MPTVMDAYTRNHLAEYSAACTWPHESEEFAVWATAQVLADPAALDVGSWQTMYHAFIYHKDQTSTAEWSETMTAAAAADHGAAVPA